MLVSAFTEKQKKGSCTSQHSGQRDDNQLVMQSGKLVHLQWSLRPLPGFGFHGNIICSILRLALFSDRNYTTCRSPQCPIVMDSVKSFSLS